MNVRDLIPWGRNRNTIPATTNETRDHNPFLTLHREMNRLFDNAFRDFGAPLSAMGDGLWFPGAWPQIEISETDKQVRVTAEIPGMDEKDIELVLEGDILVLRGERRSESEDRERAFSERFYGRFERHIPLGGEIEESNVQATFKNGLLTVNLPKSAAAQSRVRRIAINGQPHVH
jgi:HSP20 family protein